jgi:hypothetical protein
MDATQALTELSDVLAHAGASGHVRALAQAALVMHDHPAWAVWLPAHGSGWTATRPAGSRPPGPNLPMLWVHADTAEQLVGLIQAADSQIDNR